MKLEILKVATAVSCPQAETVFQDKEYDITEIDSFKIHIKKRRALNDGTCPEVYTSYFNAVYWKVKPESESKDGQPTNKQPNGRGAKAPKL